MSQIYYTPDHMIKVQFMVCSLLVTILWFCKVLDWSLLIEGWEIQGVGYVKWQDSKFITYFSFLSTVHFNLIWLIKKLGAEIQLWKVLSCANSFFFRIRGNLKKIQISQKKLAHSNISKYSNSSFRKYFEKILVKKLHFKKPSSPGYQFVSTQPPFKPFIHL